MISQEKASTSIQGIISEKFPTIGLGRGSPKNPQKCSVRERRSLNTCQDHIVLSISQVQILLCPFLFSLLTLQLHRTRNQVGKSQEKQKRWVRKEERSPPFPQQAVDLHGANWRVGKVGVGTLPLSKDGSLSCYSGWTLITELNCCVTKGDWKASHCLNWPGLRVRGGRMSSNVHCKTAYVTPLQSL